ncbi:glycosyl transferase group 1 [Chloroherpeton thalassium ATCC 35110]|uniref:Glycosyl transferase group 1 n=1 Tax=Chloroherpeton thalassium (strain ATCC 35110 / GB-78) TaxID=517418 RepID=B3QUJ7_CHLT3|nr:glycosyltransferase [Chloroherpeton thalassium]ACF12903.1 glycosyl transferase group 1 [Chloroherpeton thalassium ATCC 35110]
MKISYISTFFPLRGGIAHFNTLLYKELSARGHQLHAITFSRQYPKLFFPGKTQEETGGGEEIFKTHAEILLDSINPFSWIRVGWRVRKQAPDIILFKYWITFFAPAYFTISFVAKLFRKTKVIFILDNFFPHEKRFGDAFLHELAIRTADGYLAMSEKVERDIQTHLPRALYIKAPHPVYNIFGDAIAKSEARALLGLNPNEKVILFFGYIRKYKGLDLLLDALPQLLKKYPDLKLLIAGEFYGDEAEYRKKIDDMGLWKHLLLQSDYIPNHEVARYFCAADCIVLPYRSATQSGIAQIAYHFERPAIATNVGGLKEVVLDGKTGYLASSSEPKEIAAAIIRFYEAFGKVDFEKHMREEKKKYSWENFANAIEQLAEKLQA